MLEMSAILLRAGLNPEACFLEGASVPSADKIRVFISQPANTGEDWSNPDSGKTNIVQLRVD